MSVASHVGSFSIWIKIGNMTILGRKTKRSANKVTGKDV